MPDLNAGPPPSFDELMERYLSGNLNPDEASELLALLESNPELNRRVLDQFSVDQMMRELTSAERKTLNPVGVIPSRSAPIRVHSPLPQLQRSVLGIAAAAALIALTVFVVRNEENPRTADAELSRVPHEEATTGAVAALSRTVDAVWQDKAESRAAGMPLDRGWLKLESGLADIEFYCGARIVLEGPAELQLLSFNEAFCPRGKLTAEVPSQARGFRVNTPLGSVIDLGTAFGLSVNDDTSEVHVFKGEVDLVSHSDTRTGLKEGHAVTIGRDGVMHFSEARQAAFSAATGVDRLSGDALAKRLAAWHTAAQRVNADSSLIAHFDFENIDPQPRVLRNTAISSEVKDAAIIGCEPVRGRWPGKGALEISGVGDRIRLEVAGDLHSVTMAAWVRVDGLDRTFNSLLMSEGFSAGALHWQINQKGVVHIGVQGPGNSHSHDYGTPVVFTPERFGRWTHLAVTFDADAGKVTHYVDGLPVAVEAIHTVVPLHIGRADLGNWTVGTHSTIYPIRHFSGRMDEFNLYKRALSDSEILELYSDGSPQPRRTS